MNRYRTVIIKSCSSCPHIKRNICYKDSIDTVYECTITIEPDTKEFAIVEDLFKIPEWCPMPEIQEG